MAIAMAEFILATDTRGGYGDGAVMHANNDVFLLWRHTEIITDHRKIGGDFFKPTSSMAFKRLSAVSKWKFERVSQTEIRRIFLADMTEEILSGTPNAEGHTIDVPLYVALRKAAGKRAMFGPEESVVWFEGQREITLLMLSTLWTETITPETGLLEADHKQRNHPPHFLKRHFVIAVTDFDNTRRGILESSDWDETDPDNPVLISKRKYKVDWRNLSGVTAGTIADVEDPKIKVEPKKDVTYVETDIVEAKAK